MAGTPSDRDVWEQIRDGDAGAFSSFYRAQAPRLRNFLRHYLADAQAADDAMQEAFLQIWRYPNGFNPRRGTLRAYLFGIGRKRAADFWRKHGGERQQAALARLESVEALALVGDALGRLNAESRGLLWLREVEGYSYAELAEILAVPVGTVKSRLFAAREELRRLWNSRRPGS